MSSSGAIRAGRAFVELFADNTRLQQGLRLAETQLKEFGAKVSTMGKQIATVSLVPLIPAGIGTKIFAGFDDQMRAVQAVTGSTGESGLFRSDNGGFFRGLRADLRSFLGAIFARCALLITVFWFVMYLLLALFKKLIGLLPTFTFQVKKSETATTQAVTETATKASKTKVE